MSDLINYAAGLFLISSIGLGVKERFTAKDNEVLRAKIALKNGIIHDLNGTISKQNKAITDLSVEYTDNIIIYNRDQPQLVAKYVTQYLSDINSSIGDCKNVKSIFDNVRDIGI